MPGRAHCVRLGISFTLSGVRFENARRAEIRGEGRSNMSGVVAGESRGAFRIRIAGWLMALLLWAFSIGWFLMPPAGDFVDRFYSRGLYRWMTALIVPITSRAPFSLALTLLIGGVLLFLALWALNWAVRRGIWGMPHWRGLIWGPKWAFLIAPFLLTWFIVFWGAGYQRLTPEQRLKLDTSAITPEESEQLRGMLLEVMQHNLPADAASRDAGRALASAAAAMRDIFREWDGATPAIPSRVKATPKGLLLFNSTSGICAPFTLEAHVDGALPDTWFVSTGAHELAHIAGMCREEEAEFIGYAAGLRASDPFARYAAALNLYLDIARQLPSQQYREAVEKLPETAREDIKRMREISQRYRVDWFSKISWRVYDSYLKSQGIAEGVKNYQRGVALFVYAWRQGLVNVPAPPPPVDTVS